MRVFAISRLPLDPKELSYSSGNTSLYVIPMFAGCTLCHHFIHLVEAAGADQKLDMTACL